MSVKELEKAVQELPSEEFDTFVAWFEEYLADRWEEQIERDIKSGRLNGLADHKDYDSLLKRQ